MTNPFRVSRVQWAYMKDPIGFEIRMKSRGEMLWTEGYTVAETTDAGIFAVNTPKGERHLVDAIRIDCTCAYQNSQEVPQVACKHLQGLEQLVSDQLGYYTSHIALGSTEFRAERLRDKSLLRDHWENAVHLVAMRQAEADEAASGVMEADRAEREIRETGFSPV